MSFENEPTQPAIVAAPPWLVTARSKTGEREIAGDKDNPFIVECLKLAGLPVGMQVDETSWCGAFVNWCMCQNGIKGPKGPAGARNWLKWGQPLAGPALGCVVVFSRPPNPSSGHVALWVGASNGPVPLIQCFGGNQNNQVGVKPYPRSRLLGYRWPVGVALPK
jgi:uncharacterized protein (TIGR02594 family)